MSTTLGSKAWQKQVLKALSNPNFKFKPSHYCLQNKLPHNDYTHSEKKRILAAQAFIMEHVEKPKTIECQYNYFTLTLPIECLEACHHQGQCDQDVEFWQKKLNLQIDPEDLKKESGRS